MDAEDLHNMFGWLESLVKHPFSEDENAPVIPGQNVLITARNVSTDYKLVDVLMFIMRARPLFCLSAALSHSVSGTCLPDAARPLQSFLPCLSTEYEGLVISM